MAKPRWQVGFLRSLAVANAPEQAIFDRLGRAVMATLRATAATGGTRRQWHGRQSLLANPVYMGVVRWGGVEQPGTHQPIVTPELFKRVQGVLRLHDTAGTRERKHPHQLTGALYCASCGSRLCLTVSKGRPVCLSVSGSPQRASC